MYPCQEIAERFRSAVLPVLEADTLEFVNEWINDVGEYQIAVTICAQVAAEDGIELDPALVQEAIRFGFVVPGYP